VDVWTQYFSDIPCAVTVVPTKSFGSVGGIIEINLLALTTAAARKRVVVEAAVPPMASYGPCIRAGEFLLPSGLMAIGPDGAVVGAGTSPALDGLAHAGYTQAAAIYRYVDALCAAVGTSMANVVRAQYFVSSIDAFPGIASAWSNMRGEQPHPFLCVQVPGALPAPGAVVMADLWIYVP
jgi:enamine deaminase RidA (YjgF/YER057c/UK114 family)